MLLPKEKGIKMKIFLALTLILIGVVFIVLLIIGMAVSSLCVYGGMFDLLWHYGELSANRRKRPRMGVVHEA